MLFIWFFPAFIIDRLNHQGKHFFKDKYLTTEKKKYQETKKFSFVVLNKVLSKYHFLFLSFFSIHIDEINISHILSKISLV